MNKNKKLLDYEDFLSNYSSKNIKCSLKGLFPLYLNSILAEEFAYLIGKVMGDGNLDSKFTSRFIGQKEDLILLKDLIVNKFNLDPKSVSIREKIAKGTSYTLQINNSSFGRILHLLGAPIGNKTKTSFMIPEWVLVNNFTKKRFLQALLEDELTTIKIERCNYSVKPRLKLAKRPELIDNLRKFMQQTKEAIESFSVDCNHISQPVKGKSGKTQELYFHINRNKRNIIKFKENIGFRLNQDKIKKLEECYRIIKNSL